MRKEATLTVTLHIGGKQVDKLPSDKCDGMAQRLSESMSLYYTNHPEEYANLKKKG